MKLSAKFRQNGSLALEVLDFEEFINSVLKGDAWFNQPSAQLIMGFLAFSLTGKF